MAPFLEQELRNASFTNMAKRCACLLSVQLAGVTADWSQFCKLLQRSQRCCSFIQLSKRVSQQTASIECSLAEIRRQADAGLVHAPRARPVLWRLFHSWVPERRLSVCAGRRTMGCCWTC